MERSNRGTRITRRTFLVGIGLTLGSAAMPLLAACQAGGQAVPTAAPTGAAATAAPAAPTPAPAAPTQTAAAPATAAAAPTPVAQAAPTAGAATGQPIRVGMIVGKTGYLAALTADFVDAAQIATDQLNGRGGALGRPLQLVIEDNRSDPAAHVTILQQFLARKAIDVLVCGNLSAGTRAMAPILAQNKLPSVVASTLPKREDDPNGYKWLFSTVQDYDAAAVSVLKTLSGKGLKNLAVMHDQSPAATLMKDILPARAPEFGVTIVALEQYNASDQDFKPFLLKIRERNPEALIQAGTGPSVGIIAKNRAELGMNIPHVAAIGGVVPQEVLDVGGAAATNVLWPAIPIERYDLLPAGPEKDRLRPFVEAWRAKYRERQIFVASQGYDAILMMTLGIQKAGTTEGEPLRDALETLQFDGMVGTYTLGPERHTGTQDFAVVRLKQDGSIELY